MSALKNHLVVILVLSLAIKHLCFVAAKERVLPEFTVWHVSVVNGLSNNSELLVHCKSKDNDLGIHNLWPGTNFNWSFRENFFQRTLFWCYARKDDVHSSFKVFWQDALLFYKCLWKNCIWVAKDDGIYIKNLDQGHDEFRYTWEPGQQK